MSRRGVSLAQRLATGLRYLWGTESDGALRDRARSAPAWLLRFLTATDSPISSKSRTEPHRRLNMLAARNAAFGVFMAVALAAFWAPLSMLIRFSFRQEQYSHIILIPLVSAVLIFLDRTRIFSHLKTCWGAGLGLLLAGTLLYALAPRYGPAAGENDQLAIETLSAVIIWAGGFVLCYGIRAFRVGRFPMLFLLLMVPIPDFLLSRAIFWLRSGSAEVSYALFQLLGVPVLRSGFIFSLPGVTIEIAQECSGIRSSLALVIMGLLAGHLFLRSPWTKAALALAVLPLAIVKNGIRIVTLSLLSIYVDPSFLTGRLHHQGGIVFFLLALVLLAPVVWLLQRSERSSRTSPEAGNGGASLHA